MQRNTFQRQLILSAVEELNCHATAEEVYSHINHQYPTISKATVYRNLNQLAEGGNLLNIGYFNGATHYDHNIHAHHHFACDVCGKVFDIDTNFGDILGKIGTTIGFNVSSYSLSFGGLCDGCAIARDMELPLF